MKFLILFMSLYISIEISAVETKQCQFILLKNGKKIFGKYKVQGNHIIASKRKIPITDVEDLKAKGKCN